MVLAGFLEIEILQPLPFRSGVEGILTWLAVGTGRFGTPDSELPLWYLQELSIFLWLHRLSAPNDVMIQEGLILLEEAP